MCPLETVIYINFAQIKKCNRRAVAYTNCKTNLVKAFFYFSNHFKKVQNTLLYKVIDIKFVLKSVMMSPKHLCLILIRKMLLAQNPPKTLAINFGFFSLTSRKLKFFRISLTGPHSVL